MAKVSSSNHESLKRPLTLKKGSISFIIIVFKDIKSLKKCIRSISKLSSLRHEIIIIQNNSSLNVNFLNSQKNVTIIKNQKNRGVAFARNQGITAACGKYFVFIDDDAYFKNVKQLKNAINYLQKNEKVGLLAPKVFYPNGMIQESIRRFPTLQSLLWRGTVLSTWFPQNGFYQSYLYLDRDRDTQLEVDWALGACLIGRADVIKQIGGFDNNFFLGYDDVEICRRLKRNNYKVVYYPKLEVIHVYQRMSNKGIITKQKLLHLKSIIRFFLT